MKTSCELLNSTAALLIWHNQVITNVQRKMQEKLSSCMSFFILSGVASLKSLRTDA